ncbi:MAG: S-layer family protein [Pelatocladus maniniholoensis HA4357-MV3]|jgi:filamentous hemagglutinin family protein|uniref:S-layer family protein n=1 Tax=Pelatocladus maniniholoensis HA4357-MV3 TaxID=1117104 RepID=A0A9E3H8U9_9NOST|nr:S-layer family protein [Pelatocladus maniniholoensis HA4357-MV3]
MTQLRHTFLLLTLPVAILETLAFVAIAQAQITPDTSLGAESSTTNPDVIINGIRSDRIDGGATRGSSLFHSFQEFNVGEGRGAYFSNPAGIANILTRVTGDNPSNILGRLGVLGNANLFLLNPKGIFFGPNASLDLGGSFFGTTADSFIFNNNFEFSATNPQAVPLLSVNIPIGLRFRENPGSITNQSIVRDANSNLVGLQVQPGNSLALVGGNINLSNAENFLNGGRLTATGGSIELGGLATAGTVGLDVTGNSFKLNFPTNGLLSDITLSNARVQNNVLPGTTGIAGDVNITTNNLSLINGGQISASTNGVGNAGSVMINATGNISADGETNNGNRSGIYSVVNTSGVGDSGGIEIKTNNLSLTNGALISASTGGKGSAGGVIINAIGNISADGETNNGNRSGIFSQVDQQDAEGSSSGIEINTKDLFLTNGGQISASTFGNGNAGRVIINATGNISADGETNNGQFISGIYSVVNTSGVGDSGGIEIKTNNLSLTNGGQINASTFGTGDAGNVIINAIGNISAQGEDKDGNNSGIFSQVDSRVQGNSGGIQINTKDLSLTDGGRISASTFRNGNAGRVIINATGNISASGESNNGQFLSGIYSIVGSLGIGDSGGIEIKTNNLSLTNGARINATTSGIGNAGSVIINATGSISAQGESSKGLRSGIFSQVNSTAEGNAGGIQINAKDISLTDGGQIDASTNGIGNAGRVIINSTGNISASGESNKGFFSGIFSQVNSTQKGDAGGIEISTKDLSLTDGGQIDASTFGKGNAGSVIINATGNISASGESNNGQLRSGIFSQVNSTAEGNAGGIQINAKDISLTDGGQIDASTFGNGNAGRIIINATGNISAQGESNNGELVSGIYSIVASSGIGDSGGIEIKTNNLSLTNGARINASTSGNGNAGSVIINSTGNISASGESNKGFFSGIFSIVGSSGVGDAGGIEINTNNLSLVNSGRISASILGEGNAGNVIINATGNISASGEGKNGDRSGIFSSVAPSGVGNAGGIKINARSLSLSNRAILSASSQGSGAAGNIEVTTVKDIRLDNRALITASTTGGQGNIFLNSRDLILRRNSNITTNATGTATGGNIRIVTGNFVALENSDITANAQRGVGGDIFIKAAYRFSSPDSNITAASDLGTDFSGTVQINNTDVDPSQGLMQLPDNPTDPSNQIAQNPCQKGFGSTFFITGRGGVPSSPNDSFTSDNVRVDLAQPANSSSSQAVTINQPKASATTKQIIPARGWIFNEKGEVVLTAYDVNSREFQRQYLRQNSAGCKVPSPGD